MGPVPFEAPPLPAEDGLGTDKHQCRLPLLPDFPQTHPKQSIHLSDLRTANGPLENCRLLAKREIFEPDLFITSEHQKDRPQDTKNCIQHESGSVMVPVAQNQPISGRWGFGEGQDPYPLGDAVTALSVLGQADRSQSRSYCINRCLRVNLIPH